MNGQHRHVLIANPENRRVEYFQNALQRRGYRPASVLAWSDLIDAPELLCGLVDEKTVLRIDSPGENDDVERKLIALGASDEEPAGQTHQQISSQDALNLKPDTGRIRYLRQWYLGFQEILRCIESTAGPEAKFYNHPQDIQLMFDKPRCQAKLAALGIPTAESIDEAGSFHEIVAGMRQREWKRVFIKPAHGSSASGVIALTCFGDQLRAVTPVESESVGRGFRYYNNLNLKTYTDVVAVERIVNFFCREGVQVEQWLPKTNQDGRNLDLRILVVAGHACHSVVRTSRSPITNLHLGNKRGDLNALIESIGSDAWDEIRQTACHATTAVPCSLYAGVDVLVQPRTHKPIVLELNAFGDLLPRVTHQAMDAWEIQVANLHQHLSPN